MNRKILYTLPALLLLVGCSKGTEVEDVQQKQAIVNQVAEGSAKRLGKDDFKLDMNLNVDGNIKNSEIDLDLDDVEVNIEGAFDFPTELSKGSDIKNINAYLGIDTDGEFTAKINGATTNVDCEGKLAEFYFDDGTFYSDVYNTDLAQFFMSMFAPKQALPQKYKINLSELIDPEDVLDIQDDFEMENLDPEILSQIKIYTSDDKYTFEIDTSEMTMKDDNGVKQNLKDYFGVDLEGELVVDSSFRLVSIDLEGDVNITKLDQDKQTTGELSIDFELELDYTSNSSMKKASNKEQYKDFKLKEFFA